MYSCISYDFFIMKWSADTSSQLNLQISHSSIIVLVMINMQQQFRLAAISFACT